MKYKLGKAPSRISILGNYYHYLKKTFGYEPFTEDQALDVFAMHTCYHAARNRLASLRACDSILEVEP